MLKHADDLPIENLAAAANVTVRAIRFYQSEGLMDAPGLRGVKVMYGDADVRRLELIRAFKDEGYSLAAIRDRLHSMDDTEIPRELHRLREGRRSAADYARSIRLAGERPVVREQAAQRAAATPARRSRDSWERITLTPNLELHVRSPLSHHETKLVSRLVELADRLINTGEGL